MKNQDFFHNILENIMFYCSEYSPEWSLDNKNYEQIFENLENIFQCFLRGIEVIFVSMICSSKWNYDLVNLVKTFRYLENNFGFYLQFNEGEILENSINIEFF